MKIKDISETTSGGIAVVAQPVGKMIKRPNPSVFSKKKKTSEVDEVAQKCWPGHKKVGTQPGTGKNKGKRVNKCVKEDESGMIGAPDYNPARGGYTDNMIGKPDGYYDAEERQEAYDQLQDALAQCDRTEAQYVKDGSCPECAGSGYMDGDYEDEDGEENDECNGWGNYGCDEGEMQYNNDTVSWVEIMKHDEKSREKAELAKKPQPSDEILVGAMKQLHKNYVETGKFNAMELPRILRQMYPEISKQKAREIGGKFFHSFRNMNDEMSEDYNPRLVTMLANFEDECNHYYKNFGDTDMITIDKLLKAGQAEEAAEEMAGAMSDADGGTDNFDHIYDFAKGLVDDYLHEPAMAEMRKPIDESSDEVMVAKMLAKALGDANRWTEMSAPELFAELESTNPEVADMISNLAKMLYDVRLQERVYKDVGTADMVKDRRGKEFKFHKDAKQFKSVDGEIAGLDTKLGKDLMRIRKNQMKRTTPSYPGNK